VSEKTKSIFLGIFGLIIIGILGWGFIYLIKWIIEGLSKLNPNMAVAIVAGSVTVTVSILSVIISRHLENRAQIIKEHREKKIPVYEAQIKFLFKILMGSKTGKAPNEKEIIEFMSDNTQRIMIWGSDSVLAEFVKFRRLSLIADKLESPIDFMITYEDFLKEIRKDLGHKNKGLKRGDILSLFVNDIDAILNKS
jgi:ABC-type multidrug transport system fused ATPase/permease subunit